MKKNYATILSLCFAIFIAQNAFTFSGGAPSGSSGGPAGGGNGCDRAGCHSGPAASTQTVNITTNIPATGFEENTVYQITVSANNNGVGSNRIGFATTVESTSGHEGDLSVSNASTTRKTGDVITHTFSGLNGSGGANSWTFDWDSETAPDQTTVYTAVNFSNQNGSTSGDVVVTQSLALSKSMGIGQAEFRLEEFSAYPNPAIDQMTVVSTGQIALPFEAWSADGKQFGIEANSVDSKHWTLEVADLPSGIYILKDQGGHQLSFTKR